MGWIRVGSRGKLLNESQFVVHVCRRLIGAKPQDEPEGTEL